METYAGTGLVRFEYKNFAFLDDRSPGNESNRAAEAAECANEVGQFWPYHDILFLNQRGENAGAFDDDNLRLFASAIGLEEETFNACLDSGRYQDLINEEEDQARELGVEATPTLRINGELIRGGPSFEQLQSIIQSEVGG